MFLAYNWNNVWQSVQDTWLPILVPFAILLIIFIIIAIVRKNKD